MDIVKLVFILRKNLSPVHLFAKCACAYQYLNMNMQGGLKMSSILVDSMESTQIVSPSVDSTCRKSICARLRKNSVPGPYRGVENVVDSIESTQIVSPSVDSSCRKSICARRDSMRIESSRKVPHTNRLKFVATF